MARSIRQRKASFQAFRRRNARKRGSLPLIRSSRFAPHLPFGPNLVSTILAQYQQDDVGFRSVFVNY
jgi:hypothetical protein